MTREAVPPLRGGTQGWLGPWAGVGAALAVAALACVIHAMGWGLEAARFLLILGATILAGKSVERMLRRLRPDEESRMEVGSLTAVASLVPLLGYLAADKAWDSAQFVLVALIAVGVVGTGLILMPVAYRKLAVVGLILLHFGGILMAVLCVDTGGQPAPWLPTQAWVYFYRPYLQFMYLNNAYHFYSPEPGPPSLINAYVIYRNEDNSVDFRGEWYKYPDRENTPTQLDYQRQLALGMSIEQVLPRIADPIFNEKLEKRVKAGKAMNPEIIMHPNMPVASQYLEPQLTTRMLLASYARHIARTHQELKEHPEYKFFSVKIYRVSHWIIEPQYLAAGFLPTEETLNYPFFQGEFNDKGEVVYGADREVIITDLGGPVIDERGEPKEKKDPFLYWLLPVWRLQVDVDPATNLWKPTDPKDPKKGLLDCKEIHARYEPRREPK